MVMSSRHSGSCSQSHILKKHVSIIDVSATLLPTLLSDVPTCFQTQNNHYESCYLHCKINLFPYFVHYEYKNGSHNEALNDGNDKQSSARKERS